MCEYDILVIDDEKQLCELLATLLTRAGHRVRTAQNASEAEVALQAGVPPLILCDITMPGRSGLEFVAGLKRKGVSSAVVMVTAHEEKERILEALRLGCVDYVVKPFDLKRLVVASAAWIELGRSLQVCAEHCLRLDPGPGDRVRSIEIQRFALNELQKETRAE
jgi:DNA-binding NtrC family response regulator